MESRRFSLDERAGLRSPGQREQCVTQFARAALEEILQLRAHRRVQGRLLIALQHGAPQLPGPRGRIVRAVLPPALEVLGGCESRSPEALPEALERVLGAQEIASRADLRVRRERERALVERDRRELPAQQLQQLDVEHELLEARDEAALQPPGRL